MITKLQIIVIAPMILVAVVLGYLGTISGKPETCFNGKVYVVLGKGFIPKLGRDSKVVLCEGVQP